MPVEVTAIVAIYQAVAAGGPWMALFLLAGGVVVAFARGWVVLGREFHRLEADRDARLADAAEMIKAEQAETRRWQDATMEAYQAANAAISVAENKAAGMRRGVAR